MGGTVWRLIQIHCAQRAIQFEAEQRLSGYSLVTVEMLSVATKYHRKGYGSYLINNALQRRKESIHGDHMTLLAFTATPSSAEFYKEYGFKQFIKVFIGVELTFYGFLYNPNSHHLDQLISVFPKKL